ncbi:MacB family efflux pump subunit [Campylobacter geochelonis]|uniref:MacB family efflux pump subunit n=1 Tax=Campylobacter geochelonis TaxID=1780362 RepID=UPI00077076EA|nr:MacB family efflux pump subunit [Campylobacter geochelonis]CZE48845.1 macrolide export ATP-binding/permease protein MacB [Campylobacter geochelonis]CZE49992.1 macrolide export ATP-binding/permease protein MacB [Campylobacter geochelonis]
MIKLESINKKFRLGENIIHVLKDVNLEIKKGEFIAIIGQSGSGKSTLMNIIGCLDTPTSGIYKIDDKDVSRLGSDELANLRSKKFGFVFQRYNLIASMSAASNVSLPAVYAGVDAEVRHDKAIELLDGLELKDKSENLPNKLSGGQQQRVSIARALINGGEIILADEPTGALDSKSGLMVMDILSKLYEKGHTVIIVTHDINVANYANRIIEIKDGEILSDNVKSDKTYKLEKVDIKKKNPILAYKDQLVESFKMSVSAIFSHKLRSLLTMLGIIIGIASVICVVALGQGSQEKILSSIRAIGTNTINIYPGKNFGDMRSGAIKTLTVADSQVLASQPYLDYSTPNVSTSGTLTYANLSSRGNLQGGGVNSLAVNGIKIASGRSFTDNDIKESSSVVIIDENTKNTFFQDTQPLGKVILFNSKPLSIIGVTLKDDNAFGSSDTLRIYAPYTTVMNKISGSRDINSITVKIKDNINAQMAEASLSELLIQRHGTKDFFTRNSDTIKQTVESTTGTMRILISSIAFISLIVGGIGVMNIMLVSVTERTKEIGVRMAIGAKESNILQQFLIEAILLCVIGGVIGVSVAYGLGVVFNIISTDFAMIFSPTPAIIALVASSAIGIIFGYLPARNASKLNPIDALSQE